MSSEQGIPDSFSREYPQRPIVTTVACVFCGDRLLLIKRGQEPNKGRWSVPGGAINLGEKISDAVRREVREECGIEIEVVEVINVTDGIFPDESGRIWFHYVPIYILARYVSGEAHAGSDASEVRWVIRDELDTFDLSTVTCENVIRAFDMARDLGLF
jgi:8-oxo-dGTP diphosphatase